MAVTSYLNTLLEDWRKLLTDWAASGRLTAAAREALLLKDEPELLRKLVGQWSKGDFSGLPPIVLLPSSSMPGAAGAYAISTGTIYLNQDWLQTASHDWVMAVLTEELGHHLDGLLNVVDTPGDEGEKFSQLIFGFSAASKESEDIFKHHENDKSSVFLGSLLAEVELSSIITPQLIYDIRAGQESSFPAGFVHDNSIVYFIANPSGEDQDKSLWRTDGTKDGTWQVTNQIFADFIVSANINNIILLSGQPRNKALGVNKLIGIDGSTSEALELADIYLYDSESKAEAGTYLYFFANDNQGASNLWRTDGTAKGTHNVTNWDQNHYYTLSITGVGSVVFFTAYNVSSGTVELWKTQADSDSIVLLKTSPVKIIDRTIYSLTNYKGDLYFVAYDATSGWAIWTSDGTLSGTKLLKNIQPSTYLPNDYDSFPIDELTVSGDNLFFRATTQDYGNELWLTDGTGQGTRISKDLQVGQESSGPRQLVDLDGSLYYTAIRDGKYGLWKTTKLGSAELIYDSEYKRLWINGISGANLFFSVEDGPYTYSNWVTSHLGSTRIDLPAYALLSEIGPLNTSNDVIATVYFQELGYEPALIKFSANEDQQPFRLSTSSDNVSEGKSIDVTIFPGINDTDSAVFWRAEGTINASDFINSQASGIITLDGAFPQTLTLEITADNLLEGPESFQIILYADDEYNNVLASTETINVVDNDSSYVAWTRIIGSASNEQVKSISINSDGSIWIAGWTEGAVASGLNLGGKDTFVASYASNGSRSWIRQFGSNRDDIPYDIYNNYIVGSTAGSFDGQFISSSAVSGQTDAFLAYLDASGSNRVTRLVGDQYHQAYYSVTAGAPSTSTLLVSGYDNGRIYSPYATSGYPDGFTAFISSSSASKSGSGIQSFGDRSATTTSEWIDSAFIAAGGWYRWENGSYSPFLTINKYSGGYTYNHEATFTRSDASGEVVKAIQRGGDSGAFILALTHKPMNDSHSYNGGSLYKINQDGSSQRFYSFLGRPADFKVAQNGQIWVAENVEDEYGNLSGSLFRLSATGEEIQRSTVFYNSEISAIAFDGDGAIYVTGSTDGDIINQETQGGQDVFLAKIQIQSEDQNLPEIAIQSPNIDVFEDSHDRLAFILTRSGLNTENLTIHFTVTGMAAPGIDYMIDGINDNSFSRSTTFAAGSSTAIIYIQPIPDTEIESDETIILQIAPENNYRIGQVSTATGVILEDDAPFNTPPTGSPYLYGDLKTDSRLTIDISTLQDIDNINGYIPSYRYSWESADNTGETQAAPVWQVLITADANDSDQHLVVTDDLTGKLIRGVVTYVDGLGTTEILNTPTYFVGDSNNTVHHPAIDFTGDGLVNSIDTLVMLRYMFGTYPGDAMVQGISDVADNKVLREKIVSTMEQLNSLGTNRLDIDGDGFVNPLSDGLAIAFYVQSKQDSDVVQPTLNMLTNSIKQPYEIDSLLSDLAGF